MVAGGRWRASVATRCVGGVATGRRWTARATQHTLYTRFLALLLTSLVYVTRHRVVVAMEAASVVGVPTQARAAGASPVPPVLVARSLRQTHGVMSSASCDRQDNAPSDGSSFHILMCQRRKCSFLAMRSLAQSCLFAARPRGA